MREVGPRILVAIRRYARDDHHAQDLLQDCWAHILERLDRFRGDTSFAKWAIRVSKNLCSSKRRDEKRKGIKEVPLGGSEDAVAGDSEALEEQRRHMRHAVYAGLARIPDRERDAIVLRVMEGRSPAATAERLEVSRAGERAIFRRGMRKLARTKELRGLFADWKGFR